jgi:hypothetical protein
MKNVEPIYATRLAGDDSRSAIAVNGKIGSVGPGLPFIDPLRQGCRRPRATGLRARAIGAIVHSLYPCLLTVWVLTTGLPDARPATL